jgi:hypothetical protein
MADGADHEDDEDDGTHDSQDGYYDGGCFSRVFLVGIWGEQA